uniref:Uncharacterized protein n=2 Tax=Brassica oleracea TaxID=3712 RepID=A0A0D3CVW1_BRAOL|nr:unnamed protein product [Brassica oleracea]
MGDEVDRRLYAVLDEAVDEYIEDTFNNIVENRTVKPSLIHLSLKINERNGYTQYDTSEFEE